MLESFAYFIAGAAIALGIAGYAFWQARPVPVAPGYPVRRTVIVNLPDEQAIRGVLWETTPEHLVLKGAELLQAKIGPTAMDGDVVVYRSRVAWIQVVPGG